MVDGLAEFNWSSTEDRLGFVVKRWLAVEHASGLSAVELSFPPGNNHRGDCIADKVGEGAHLRHEAVNAQQQRYACHGNRSQRGECRGQCDETPTRYRCCALG